MKFNVDDGILRIFKDLPQEFKRSNVLELLQNDSDEPRLSYQLQKMEDAGMIQKITPKTWNKKFANPLSWFRISLQTIGVEIDD